MLMRATGCSQHALVTAEYRKSITCSGLQLCTGSQSHALGYIQL